MYRSQQKLAHVKYMKAFQLGKHRALAASRLYTVASPNATFKEENGSNKDEQECSKIYALPFKISPDKPPRIVGLISFMTEHKLLGLFRLLKTIFLKTLPPAPDPSQIRMRKAYLPFWYYDMAVKATVTRERDGEERELLGMALNGYWMGHTLDSPLLYLSFGFPISVDKSDLQPFSEIMSKNDNEESDSDYNNGVDDIEVIPFSTDPFQDLAQHVPKALEGLRIGRGKQAVRLSNAELVFNAAYPLYYPVYIAQMKTASDSVIVVGGQSDNPPVFRYEPSPSQGNTDLVKKWVNSGSWIRLDVTDPSWKVGIGLSPIQELQQIFYDRVLNQKNNLTETRQPIAWNDVRIQAFPINEEDNKTYLKQLFNLWAQHSMLSHLEGMGEDSRTFGVSAKGFEMKTVREFKEKILSEVADELESLEKVEPQWLKDYNQQRIQDKGNSKEE